MSGSKLNDSSEIEVRYFKQLSMLFAELLQQSSFQTNSKSCSTIAGVLKLSLSMYPFSIL